MFSIKQSSEESAQLFHVEWLPDSPMSLFVAQTAGITLLAKGVYAKELKCQLASPKAEALKPVVSKRSSQSASGEESSLHCSMGSAEPLSPSGNTKDTIHESCKKHVATHFFLEYYFSLLWF